MSVQLQVRTQLQATQNKQVFQDRLGANWSAAQVDGRQKLQDLRAYMQSKGDNARIRVVNTTRNADLAFQFKSFGYKTYRQERTAGALTQLLIQAGVKADVAAQVVDAALKNGNNYQTATKALVMNILNDPEVQRAIAPAQPMQAAEAAAPAPLAKPLAIFAKPSAIDALDLMAGEFKSPYALGSLKARPPNELQHFKFTHASGIEVGFYNLSTNPDATIQIRNGKISFENELFIGATHQPASDATPPFKYLVQPRVNDQMVGPPVLLSRQELLENPAYANQIFQVIGAFTSSAPIPHAGAAPAESSDVAPNPPPSGAVQAAPFITTQKVSQDTLDQFLKARGLHVGNSLGQGGYGSVKTLGAAPGDNSQVVKYFEKRGQLAPEMLSLTRHTKLRSEAYAAYLMSSRNPDWVQPKVVTPTHYLVGRPVLFYPGSEELQLIPIHELKKTIRENAALGGTDLRCYGLVMDKAPGHEVAKQMNALSQNPNQRAMITQSGLEALRGLSARGFVHRDIKPANMIFNGKELNFIDTGMLFKTHKTPAEKGLAEESLDPAVVDLEHIHQLPTLRAGTPVYMHPDLAAGQKGYIGTQADLHAIGLITLEMEAPTVFAAMKGILGQVNSNKKFPPITARTFEQTLDLVIAHALTPAADKNSAEALKVNMKNPQHLANLGFECLQKANTSMPDNSAARWANREFADQQYAQLLQHPALAARNGVAA